MNEEFIKEKYNFKDVLDIVHKLRQPDGCPWDSVQTYETMKKCVTDEAQEVVEAVDNNDYINLKEELGDLLLQVLMYSEIAKEKDEFTLDDVIDELGKKLVRRHPNVFTQEEEVKKLDIEEGLSIWKAVKKKEKLDKLQEYESAYSAGKISKELIEMKRKTVQNL